MKQHYKIFLLTALFFSTIIWAYAEQPNNPANEGYSLVSYFEKNKAEMGSAEYSVEYEGKLYWFSSADQVDTFNSNPTRYLPRFSGFCAYSLTLGRKVPIDPTKFKIIADQLLLFHPDGLEEWTRASNEDELLRRATSSFLSLEF
ncbi:MAG: YHS domain-containing protein [Betaproteobacteria bacterium]|nr:YHS domain-containing protein [Betaproteobacteria bacterium]